MFVNSAARELSGRTLAPEACDTTLVSLEADHCQVRVLPPTLGQSTLQCLEKAPIVRLWKDLLARKTEVLERDSELTRHRL
jgi:hypothetical protein